MSDVPWRVWMRISDGQLGIAVDTGWLFEWIYWEQPDYLNFMIRPERFRIMPYDFEDLGPL